jgi:hypothetical protein
MALEDPIAMAECQLKAHAELKAKKKAEQKEKKKAEFEAEQTVVTAGGVASAGFWVRNMLLSTDTDSDGDCTARVSSIGIIVQ